MKLSASMICYHSAPTVWSALESIYPYAAQIVVAYGPLADWPFRSDDGTKELLLSFPDPDKKLNLLLAPEWPSRQKMRQATADELTGNYHLMIDSDEVWTDLEPWMDWLERENPVSCYAPWITPWRGMRHWVSSRRVNRPQGWGGPRITNGLGSRRKRYQWSRWGRGYYWRRHWKVLDNEGRSLFRLSQLQEDLPTRMWHFGYALPARYIREKVEYYQEHCPGLPAGHRRKEKQKEDAWFDWDGQGGIISVFSPDDTMLWPLSSAQMPPIVRQCVDHIRGYYHEEDRVFEERLDVPRA